MIDHYMLRYFLAVAEAGNFTRAARCVCVTQPTLSAGIAKLEREIGARLFDRDKRHVTLTLAGNRFLLRARRIVTEYEMAMAELRVLPKRTTLRLGVLPTIPTTKLAEMLARYRQVQSCETIEIIECSERDLIDRLNRGRLDVALSVIRASHERFFSETLRREAYLMVLPISHPLAGQERLEAEQLAGEAMVVRRHCEALPVISRFFSERGIRPRFVLKTQSDERMMAVVRAGFGVGMMPESFAGEGLVFVPVKDLGLSRDIGLIYAPAAAVTRHTSPFLAQLRAVLIPKLEENYSSNFG